jgi:ankyrin repeat protein
MLLDAGADPNAVDREDWTPLHFAAEQGNDDVIRLLSGKHAQLDAATAEGYTAVYLAAQSGHSSTIRLLTSLGARPSVADHEGWTALHAACEKGQVSAVETLIEVVDPSDLRTLINARSTESIVALYLAAQHGYTDIVRCLVDAGAEVDAVEDDGGFAPIHVACQNGHLETVSALLSPGGADPNLAAGTSAWHPIHYAAQDGYTSIVDRLIKSGADPRKTTADGHTALHVAAENGHVETVRLLLGAARTSAAEGANDEANSVAVKDAVEARDSYGWTPLHHAVQNGHCDVVNELLAEPSVDVDLLTDDGHSSLLIAVINQHPDVVRALIKRGASVNRIETADSIDERASRGADDETVEESARQTSATVTFLAALHVACQQAGNIDVVRLLIEAGAQVDKQDHRGRTPLHFAAENDLEEYVSVLCVEGHADPNAQNADGRTAMFVAAHNGSTAFVGRLLEADIAASADRVDYLGWTPLHAAAQAGHVAVVEMLVERTGLEVDRRTYHGFTALYLAAQEGHDEVVR